MKKYVKTSVCQVDGGLYGTGKDFYEFVYKGAKLGWNQPLGACQSYASVNYTRHVHTDATAITHPFAFISKRGTVDDKGRFMEGNFTGGNFFLLKWGILIEYGANTLFAFPDSEEHGTTVIPREGYQIGWSQHISKNTVTAYRKWVGGKETKHKDRQNFVADATAKTQEAYKKKVAEIHGAVDTGTANAHEIYEIEDTAIDTIEGRNSRCCVFQRTYDLRPRKNTNV